MQTDERYRFRVSAFNEIGMGDCSEMPTAVEAVDKIEAPQILHDLKNLTVKAGNSIRLVVK